MPPRTVYVVGNVDIDQKINLHGLNLESTPSFSFLRKTMPETLSQAPAIPSNESVIFVINTQADLEMAKQLIESKGLSDYQFISLKKSFDNSTTGFYSLASRVTGQLQEVINACINPKVEMHVARIEPVPDTKLLNTYCALDLTGFGKEQLDPKEKKESGKNLNKAVESLKYFIQTTVPDLHLLETEKTEAEEEEDERRKRMAATLGVSKYERVSYFRNVMEIKNSLNKQITRSVSALNAYIKQVHAANDTTLLEIQTTLEKISALVQNPTEVEKQTQDFAALKGVTNTVLTTTDTIGQVREFIKTLPASEGPSPKIAPAAPLR